jgi:hypothetical protein
MKWSDRIRDTVMRTSFNAVNEVTDDFLRIVKDNTPEDKGTLERANTRTEAKII